jgi:hypothetical protein
MRRQGRQGSREAHAPESHRSFRMRCLPYA